MLISNGALLSSDGGNIRIWAALNTEVTAIDAALGSASITAVAGDISASENASGYAVRAGVLRLSAGQGIGGAGSFSVRIYLVAAQTGTGDVTVDNPGSLMIGTVGDGEHPVSVSRLQSDAHSGVAVRWVAQRNRNRWRPP